MTAPGDVGPVGQAGHEFFGIASQDGKCSKWLEDKNAYCDLPESAHPASKSHETCYWCCEDEASMCLHKRPDRTECPVWMAKGVRPASKSQLKRLEAQGAGEGPEHDLCESCSHSRHQHRENGCLRCHINETSPPCSGFTPPTPAGEEARCLATIECFDKCQRPIGHSGPHAKYPPEDLARFKPPATPEADGGKPGPTWSLTGRCPTCKLWFERDASPSPADGAEGLRGEIRAMESSMRAEGHTQQFVYGYESAMRDIERALARRRA